MSREVRTVLLDMGYKEDIKCHEWKRIEMKELKKGNKFKLFEPDGSMVVFEDKDTFEAVSDAFQTDANGQMVWTVEV